MNIIQEKTTDEKITFLNSLRGRITWQILLVSLIPLLIISIIFLTMLNQAVGNFELTVDQVRDTMANEVVGTKLQTLAKETMASIDIYMLERIHDIQDWASTPVVISALQEAVEEAEVLNLAGLDIAEIEASVGNNRSLLPNSAAERYLQDRLARTPAFKEVFFTDANGYNVAVSNPTSDFVQSDEAWWQIAWNKGIFISEVTYDESAQTYAVDIAIRINHPDTGQALGVMKASLDITAIQMHISNVANSMPGAEAVLLEADGYRIADSRSNHGSEFIMTEAGNLLNLGYTPVQIISNNQHSGFLLAQPGLEQTGETDELGFASSAGADFYTDVPGFSGFNWLVLFTQPTSVAFQALEPIANLQAALHTLQSSTTMSVLLVGVLAAVVSIVSAFFLANNISKPVIKLNQVARKVAAGYLNETNNVHRRDEIGSLANSLDTMTDNLRDLIGQLQQGAFQVAEASQQLNLAAEQTGQAAQQVAHGTGQQTISATEVTNNVEQIAQAAEGVARGSQEQAQAVQKTSVLINEMADVVDAVEKITGSVLEAGHKPSDLNGYDQGTIRMRTALAVEKVKEMGIRSKEIGRIVETIDDIADKTDMLALNAAVEAARAGEHGRGFAVVAEQVRKLSEDSKEATRDINGLIERVQEAVDEAIKSAEGAANLSEQISQAMAQLKQKSEGVVVAIESVSAVVEENTAVSEEMAANSQEVTDAMGGVVSIAEENSASAEEMSAQIEEVVASAEELSALAEQLKEATAQFELGKTAQQE